MRDVITAIQQEDKLIANCAKVFGSKKAKEEAHRIASRTEKRIRDDGKILAVMIPEILISRMKEKNK
jgi:hypothetical protein